MGRKKKIKSDWEEIEQQKHIIHKQQQMEMVQYAYCSTSAHKPFCLVRAFLVQGDQWLQTSQIL